MSDPATADAIAVRRVSHRYSGVLALDDVSLSIAAGSFTAIFGANGAGKSTLALLISGMLRPSRGAIAYAGIPQGTKRLVRSGICLIPEGRRLFGQLSIEENLVLGGYGAGCTHAETRRRMQTVVEHLPAKMRDNLRGSAVVNLSGGERQILAVCRALMTQPRVLLVDEPSMGLAPLMIERVYQLLAGLNQSGVTVVAVEQMVTHAIVHATNMHLLDRGRVVYSGPTTGAAAQSALRASYVGEDV